MRLAPRSLLLIALVAASWGGACGPQTKDESPAVDDETLRTRLEKKTGVKWKVDVAADGTVYAEPEGPPRMTTPATLIDDFSVDFGLLGGGLAVRKGEVHDLGDGVRAHEYYQMHDGVRVEDGSVEVHVSKEGHVELVIGRWVHDLRGLSTTPAITKQRAEQIAFDDAKAENPWLERVMLDGGILSALVIYSRGERPQLVHRVSFDASVDKNDPTADHLSLAYIIDAQSGELVGKRDRNDFDEPVDASGKGVRAYAFGETTIRKFAATKRTDGIYTLLAAAGGGIPEIRVRDASKKGAPVIESMSPTSWDERPPSDPTSAGNGAAVDAMYQVTRAAMYFSLVHQWNSWGKTGIPIQVFVHEKPSPNWGWFLPTDYSLHFPDTIVHDGKPQSEFLPGLAALHVVGHELGHGFVRAAARDGGPSGDGEQGAINEAFADLIGVAIQHFYAPDDKENWRFGGEALRDGLILVDLADPTTTKRPSHLSTIKDKNQIHANGAIVGHAFHLMTLGGVNSVSRVVIGQGIQWESFEKLLVATVRTLRPQTGFGELAWQTIRLAKRKLEIPVEPVVCSWVAVGVISSQSAKSEHGVECLCMDGSTGLPLLPESDSLSCCEEDNVACCKKCDDSILGTWQGDWGKISFANVKGEIRAAYTYREGIVLAKGEKGFVEGCWSEEPTRKSDKDVGAAAFVVKGAEARIDGRWNFRNATKWHENWDVKWVGPAVLPNFKWRMEDEAIIGTCR